MCAVIGFIGDFTKGYLDNLIHESQIRGLHHLGIWTHKNAGIIHCRYITSGDSNQPIIKGDAALAFNGVIDMGTKEEMEQRYNVKMSTDNDGELFLLKCGTDEEAMIEFIQDRRRTFAGIVLTPTHMIALRNNGRPLWKVQYGEKVLIASTRDIFQRCNIYGSEQLEPFRIYKWTL